MPTFTTTGPIDVAIKVPSGSVDVIASDRPDAVVTVKPANPGRDQDVRAARETTVEFDGSRLTIVAPKPKVAVFGTTESIEVTVEVPTSSRLTAEASVGPVGTSGVLGATRIKAAIGGARVGDTGDLWVHATHGQVTAGRVAGDLDASCDHGSIRVKSVAGAANLKSSHGNITIGDVGGEVEAKMSYGDLEISSAAASVAAKTAYGAIEIGEVSSGAIELESGFGSLTVGVREGVPAWLDLLSKNGHVRNDLASQDAPTSTEGSVSVHARTNFGHIAIHRAA
ncbi:MAG: DUF4097 family beta strand repeat-containing protein [Demequina sp.]|nr:DUF4097 family beta strand repeat-containing protein [Demequina sp.]